MVHFVGAGSGAVDLITVRGQRLLESADMVIYAGSLVNKDLLKFCKADCELHDSAYLNLDEVIALMIRGEKENKNIVRLHTGDPSIYGAIREQMDLLKKEGISFDVCPGVSSMSGAAAALNLEYTLPGIIQSVIITRAEGRTKVPERESLVELGKHGTTLILFLSSGLSEKVKADLLEAGRSKDTPVAVVYKASWPDEKIFRTTLDKLPETMKEEGINKTALIIVSDVLGDDYELSKLYDKAFTTEFRRGTE